VKRIGRDRFIRNVLIAAGNSDIASLVPRCEALLADPSPLVRGAAVWALSRLMEGAAFLAFAARLPDADQSVQDEWRTAMAAVRQ
jgi:epoxyqueuosine reductase